MAHVERVQNESVTNCPTAEMPRLSQEKSDQMQYVSSRPFVTKAQSAVLAQQLFSLQMSPLSLTGVKELLSYEDRNFLVKGMITGSQESDETEKVENCYCSEASLRDFT